MYLVASMQHSRIRTTKLSDCCSLAKLSLPRGQAPIDFMLRGKLDEEEIGLELIPGYHLEVVRMETLDCQV